MISRHVQAVVAMKKEVEKHCVHVAQDIIFDLLSKKLLFVSGMILRH